MKLLETLYKVSSPSGMEERMARFIVRKLQALSIEYTIDSVGNIYATKGSSESYPCLVAHMDEVHPRHKKSFEVVNFRDQIYFGYSSKTKAFRGIGADDKNGIWVCLKCLEEYDVIKCAFFVQEEEGCIGSSQADMDFFADCRFVLQCDRKGNSDFITRINGITLCSDEFLAAIDLNANDYTPTQGMMTDVFALKQNGLTVSCVNISCGYYEPHTSQEYTRIKDLKKCLKLVRHIVSTCTEVYPHAYTRPLMSQRYNWGRLGMFADDVDYGDLFSNRYLYGGHNSRTSLGTFPDTRGHLRQYEDLIHVLSDELGGRVDQTIEELHDRYSSDYPLLARSDFSNAYTEIMGCPPEEQFPMLPIDRDESVLQSHLK